MLHLMQDAGAVGEQRSDGLGRHRTAAVANQQGLAQLDFEQPHPARQRGLCDVECQRGAREAAGFGGPHEGSEFLQVQRLTGCDTAAAVLSR